MKAKAAVKILSWFFYDLAAKFFTLNIIALHFARWVTVEKNTPDIYYSLAFGASLVFVALFAPVIGRVSDIAKSSVNPSAFIWLKRAS